MAAVSLSLAETTWQTRAEARIHCARSSSWLSRTRAVSGRPRAPAACPFRRNCCDWGRREAGGDSWRTSGGHSVSARDASSGPCSGSRKIPIPDLAYLTGGVPIANR
eukprot:2612041-Pyramimonas_sp.AAC.2